MELRKIRNANLGFLFYLKTWLEATLQKVINHPDNAHYRLWAKG